MDPGDWQIAIGNVALCQTLRGTGQLLIDGTSPYKAEGRVPHEKYTCHTASSLERHLSLSASTSSTPYRSDLICARFHVPLALALAARVQRRTSNIYHFDIRLKRYLVLGSILETRFVINHDEFFTLELRTNKLPCAKEALSLKCILRKKKRP